MKRLTIALAACTIAAPLATQPAFAHDHGAHDVAAAANVEATGTVKSVDAKAGTVTIHHGPIASLGWPAMTMTFKATADVLKTAKPGAKVTFTLNAAGDQLVALR